MDVLRRIFQAFTTFGDRLNTTWMTEFKFYKLMRYVGMDVRCTCSECFVLVSC